MVPFCDPVGWVESFGPVVGPILAALSVVAYPVYLLYQSLLLASAAGQGGTAFPVGGAIAGLLFVLAVIAVVVLLVVVIVGAVLLACLIVLLIITLRALLKPTPGNEPRVPRRLGRRTPTG